MLPLNTDVTIYTAYLVFSFYVCFFFLFCLFIIFFFFFFSSRRRHTRLTCDWSSDVCSSDLEVDVVVRDFARHRAAALAPVGDQLADRARIHHRARDAVRADRLALLEHGDRDLAERGVRVFGVRSEERRVGKECRDRWSP